MRVPAGASSFRQVDIHGGRGLLVTYRQKREVRSVMWSEGGAVLAITAPLNEGLLVQVADSVR